MTAERKLVRIQEKGQVTLAAEVRRNLGLKKGDLISPQKVVAQKALDRVGQILRERSVDLDEMIESGRAIRGDLIKEEYGIDSDTPTS